MVRREARVVGLAALLLTVLGCGAAPEPPAATEVKTEAPPEAKTAATATVVEEAPREPATVEAATKVLDLRKFPRPEGVKLMGRPTLGSLSYDVKADLKEAYEFARKGLVDAGWKMAPDARVDDKYAQANFSREGFNATISAYPTGDAGMATVSIHNYGNVPASQIPVPTDLKPEYKFAQTAGYMTKTAKVPQVAEAIQKLLLGKGWQPYGGHSYELKVSSGQSMEFKRNAIAAHVSVTTHENRPGDTMVQISMKLLSADLPAPPNFLANGFRFDDASRTLTFDTPDKTDDVGKFYRETLAKQGWEPTTDPKGLTDMLLIFRNPAKDMIMLDVKGKKSPTHVKVTFYAAADVAEFDKRAEDKGKDEKK